ncbi:MAG: hypothetical protein PHW04_00270 [Candidatus Wallbacteria bacterium]|nr:hypothetical protein [Candidatus Wallbacteria bacterium]
MYLKVHGVTKARNNEADDRFSAAWYVGLDKQVPDQTASGSIERFQASIRSLKK